MKQLVESNFQVVAIIMMQELILIKAHTGMVTCEGQKSEEVNLTAPGVAKVAWEWSTA